MSNTLELELLEGNYLMMMIKEASHNFFRVCVCVLCREAEPAENHLKDMLQQLNTLIATKPSEKATICQGEHSLRALVFTNHI